MPTNKECRKKYLILDLDSTLIHTFDVNHGKNSIEKIKSSLRSANVLSRMYEFPGDIIGVFRPYISEFMKSAIEHFTVIIWSAGTEEYVNPIAKELAIRYIPNGSISVFNRNHCEELFGRQMKPLNVMTNRFKDLSPENTIFIDDNPAIFDYATSNISAIVINEYRPSLSNIKNDKDDSLKLLADWFNHTLNYNSCKSVKELKPPIFT